jgi:hypothetical protein
VNVLRATLHPRGLAPHVANLAQWRSHLLARLTRQVELTDDPDLVALLDELTALPCPDGAGRATGTEIAVPLRVRVGGRELAFLSTVAVFGTAVDVTVSELSIESFYPADAATRQALQAPTPA